MPRSRSNDPSIAQLYNATATKLGGGKSTGLTISDLEINSQIAKNTGIESIRVN
jgi:hypothetical protein